MKLTDYDWTGARSNEFDRAANLGATSDQAGKLPEAAIDCAAGSPCPDMERLSHSAGVDASSLTDNQIAEALLQLR